MKDRSAIEKLPPEQVAVQARCFHPSGTFREFAPEEIEQSIAERFEAIVRLYSDRTAAAVNDHAFTYAALNQAANRIARTILAKHGQRGEPVALFFFHNLNAIAAILGVLKSGNAYLPIDASEPEARIAAVLEDSQAAMLLCDNRSIALLKGLSRPGCAVLNIDEISPSSCAENPGVSVPADAMAYLMYTSGSTGEPKGVVQSHRNVLHKIRNETNQFHVSLDDRLTVLYSLGFSASVRPLFAALLNGASAFLFDVKQAAATRLASWLAEERITIYLSAATLFRQLAASLNEAEKIAHVRLVYLGSEAAARKDVELFKKHFSAECVFVNSMASGEAGTICRYFVDQSTAIETAVIPVGYAAEGKEVLLLNEDHQPVTMGEIGEIAVRSRYLACGYWRKPELTGARFLPDPQGGDKRVYLTGDLGRLRQDGCFEYMGRKDSRAKINGLWVDIALVEAALMSVEGIEQACVVIRQDRTNSRLFAFLVFARPRLASVAEVRRSLRKKLPEHMVPSVFVEMEALPRLPNGKLDRLALATLDAARSEQEQRFVAPRTAAEERLAAIWTEVLKVDRIGIHDDFFDLGGQSLLAMQIVARVREAFDVAISLRSFFEEPTVAGMFNQVEALVAKKPRVPAV